MQRYFLLKDAQTLEVYVSMPMDQAPENSVVLDPNQQYNFVKAKFDQYPNPTAVIEGADSDAIAAVKTPVFMDSLQSTASELRMRAKAAAIDKIGNSQYIVSQQELYELKYKFASGAINNAYMITLLENEAAEFGVDYEAFCELIMYMYETAKAKYEVFLLMIERCRTKIQTLIETRSWAAVDSAFALVAMLQSQEQAQEIMADILAL